MKILLKNSFLLLVFFIITSCGKKNVDVIKVEPINGLVVSAYESEDNSKEIKDFGKPVLYEYCYDGGGGPDHLILKGNYQSLLLYVNSERNDKNELLEDKFPIIINVQGSLKVNISEKISGPMDGKILIKQSKEVIFEKSFASHGCQ